MEASPKIIKKIASYFLNLIRLRIKWAIYQELHLSRHSILSLIMQRIELVSATKYMLWEHISMALSQRKVNQPRQMKHKKVVRVVKVIMAKLKMMEALLLQTTNQISTMMKLINIQIQNTKIQNQTATLALHPMKWMTHK